MFTPQQQAVLASLSRGTSRTTACHAAHLPRRTFYNWIKADPLFSEAVDDAEAESVGIAEDLAYACAMKAREDPRYQRSLFFWLKHRAGWVQARPDRAPAPPHVEAVRHTIPSPDPNAPPVDTDDLALVMEMVKDFERREREDEEFMRGYEEWKRLSEEEREALREEERRSMAAEELEHIASADPDLSLSGDGTPTENPVIGVPFVPSHRRNRPFRYNSPRPMPHALCARPYATRPDRPFRYNSPNPEHAAPIRYPITRSALPRADRSGSPACGPASRTGRAQPQR